MGSRKCSAYGRKVTYDMCFNIAKHGVGIVSGMAKGIDGRPRFVKRSIGDRGKVKNAAIDPDFV